MTSESESDYEIDDLYGAGGYQYEPEYTWEELEALDINQSEKDNAQDPNSARLGNVLWCQCGKCQPLPKGRECICCKEFDHYVDNYIGEDLDCITMHSDFDLICLTNVVLETAYVAYMRYKRIRGNAPASLTHRYVHKLF